MDYELAEALEALVEAVERQENIEMYKNYARETLNEYYISQK